MEVIESKIDVNSKGYKKNVQEMTALVDDLNKELDIAMNQRSQKALDRQAESGKIPAEKKLELLLDKNTPFLEIAPLAAKGMYDGKIHKAGVIVGIGVIEGRECMISVNDATIKGGSVYPMGVKKSLRCQAIAMENRLPMISV